MTAAPRPPTDPDALFTRRTALIVVGLGVVSFAVMIYLMARGEGRHLSLTADPSVFSSSALGHRAAAEYLRESGLSVRTRRSRRALTADPRTAVIAAEPSLTPIAKEEGERQESPIDDLRSLAAQAAGRRAPFILVLPKWLGSPVQTAKGKWIRRASLRTTSVVVESLDELSESGAVPSSVVRTSTGPIPKSLKTDAGTSVELVSPQVLRKGMPGVQPVVSVAQGTLIGLVADSDHPWYVISDPDLLNNHGLGRGENAATILAFLRDRLGVTAVVFDEVSHGFAAETPFMAELLNFPLMLMTLHGAGLFGLLVWRGFARFGKPLPLPPRLLPGKAGLIENTAQLVANRGRLLTSARRYYIDVVSEVAIRYHRDPNENPKALHQALQEATSKKGIDFNLMSVAAVMAGRRRATTAAVLHSAIALHEWRERMLDER